MNIKNTSMVFFSIVIMLLASFTCAACKRDDICVCKDGGNSQCCPKGGKTLFVVSTYGGYAMSCSAYCGGDDKVLKEMQGAVCPSQF